MGRIRATNKSSKARAKPPQSNYQNGDGEFSGKSPERIVILSGDVTEHTITGVIAQLVALASIDKIAPIHLIVSTYGGSVDEMFSLYDTIKFLPCPIYTVGLGKVMSAGVLLLASGVKGNRCIGKNARIMMHSLSGGSSGNIFEIINDTKEHERMHKSMMSSLSKETNMSIKQVEEIMKKGHDVYMTAEEAIKLGIADKIIGN
jgi:ATP-dependent Clp protease protease subunit